ncbi:hypothetical protein SB861_53100, partial [Paraburkholderia sp. SIMBA_049]
VEACVFENLHEAMRSKTSARARILSCPSGLPTSIATFPVILERQLSDLNRTPFDRVFLHAE